MAPLLGDQYLRRGAPRPLVETQASEAARSRGIATPRIVAGVSYATGLLYRADLVSEWIPGTGDLAAGLFPIDAPRASLAAAPTRRLALAAAGAMVVRLAAAGIRHRDLNAKNLLVRPDEAGGAPELWVLDLDRATVHEPGSVPPAGMGATRSTRTSGGPSPGRWLASRQDPGPPRDLVAAAFPGSAASRDLHRHAERHR
jgi:3-deoxy-D-manno-octulosonic acid kinase